MSKARVPVATYRLQLHGDLTFSQVAALTPYLSELGISDIYASPLFQAKKGSRHGYSVTNPLELNPELGSRAAFDSWCRKLRALNMGLLLDVVPNHMALSKSNPWWQDVLENGQSSPYAVLFDIDWQPPARTLKNRVLLPILGRPYGHCLEDQELTLALSPDGFAVHYYDHRFPLDPKTYLPILTHRLEELKSQAGEDSPDYIRIMGVITLVQNLPARTVAGTRKRRERLHWRDVIKKSLWLLYEKSPNLREFLDDNLRQFNGRQGEPASFDLLDSVLREQAYRLSHWLVSLEIINYRRFFSINDLIGIRVEDPQVFEATHNLLFKLVEEDKITGLRLDHIDGLNDPGGYLLRLQNRLQAIKGLKDRDLFYLVVEKILADDETLPQTWLAAGTTGYDFLGLLNNLFLDSAGMQELTKIYEDFCGLSAAWEDVVYEKKKLVMASLFGGEVRNLLEELVSLAERDRQAMDASHQDLRQALMEVSACLPVYRTYSDSFEVSPADRGWLEEALAQACRRQPAFKPLALDFLRRVLLLEFTPGMPEDQKKSWLRFVCRWQQFTGPIMAKGMEDTAAYIYNHLISLNEVGGRHRAVSLTDFHAGNHRRQRFWPATMNATSTHDTKRSEDVRARLNVLSEMPELWRQRLTRWRELNAPKKKASGCQEIPDANEEILLYQTLLGAWPLQPAEVPEFRNRLQFYLVKALREAKVHSRWHDPQLDYEQILLEFVEAILAEEPENAFLSDFLDFQARLAYYGALNSLSQVVLKIAAPGVPDFYQGNELWDFSLVDPDNRRPVDFPRRRRLLQELKLFSVQGEPSLAGALLSTWQDGRVKLFVTWKALQGRKANQELFLHGDYVPLSATAPQGEQVVAFGRNLGQNWVIAVAGRFFSFLTPPGSPPVGAGVWRETHLVLPAGAPRAWVDAITGNTVADAGPGLPLAEIMAQLPVALLTASTPPTPGV